LLLLGNQSVLRSTQLLLDIQQLGLGFKMRTDLPISTPSLLAPDLFSVCRVVGELALDVLFCLT
jgi:hypothetical protein